MDFFVFSRPHFDSDDAVSSGSKGSSLHNSNFQSSLNSVAMAEVAKRASRLVSTKPGRQSTKGYV